MPQAPRQATIRLLKRGARSNGIALRVLAQSDQSTNGRLAHNQVVYGGDIRGLTRAAHPHRGAQKLRSKYDRTASRSSEVASESPVTATVPNEAVGLRINRLPQHRMMSGNVWDGCKLVSRSYHVRYSRICSLERSRQESQNVTEIRYRYQVWAYRACLKHCIHYQCSCGGDSDRKPRRKDDYGPF